MNVLMHGWCAVRAAVFIAAIWIGIILTTFPIFFPPEWKYSSGWKLPNHWACYCLLRTGTQSRPVYGFESQYLLEPGVGEELVGMCDVYNPQITGDTTLMLHYHNKEQALAQIKLNKSVISGPFRNYQNHASCSVASLAHDTKTLFYLLSSLTVAGLVARLGIIVATRNFKSRA